MARVYIGLAAIIALGLIISGSIYIGTRWDGEAEAKRDVKIVKEIQDATTDERSDADIRERLRELAGR